METKTAMFPQDRMKQITSLRKKHGIKTLLEGSRQDDIERMFDEGHTLREIGEKHNITRERVRQLLRKANKPPRNQQKQDKREILIETAVEAAKKDGIPLTDFFKKQGVGTHYFNFVTKEMREEIHQSKIEKRLNEIETYIVKKMTETNENLTATLLQKSSPRVHYGKVHGVTYSMEYWRERIWKKYPRLRKQITVK